MVLGFARWAGKGKEFGKKVLKDKTKTISSVPPLKKIKGAMSVSDAKNKASLASFKAAGFKAGEKIKKKFQKTATEINKLNKTLKKQNEILNK